MSENKWDEFFYYDETSPTSLRWKVQVKSGKNYHIVEREVGDVAGSVKCDGNHSSVKLNGKSFLVHRVIWEIFHSKIPDGLIVDHFDQNPLNNKISNLRLLPKPFNQRNVKIRKDNTSGHTGVSYNTPNNVWKASWCSQEGKFKQKSFSVKLYGDAAKDLAVAYRLSKISELNLQGQGYTERHGK